MIHRGAPVEQGLAMSEQNKDLRHEWWAKKFNDIDMEIAGLATICDVHIFDPGVIERVLHNDPTVCGTRNDAAFSKLRSLLMMHYTVRAEAVERLGAEDTAALVAEIVNNLRERIGLRPIGGAY
jgi:uridine phosphorylase